MLFAFGQSKQNIMVKSSCSRQQPTSRNGEHHIGHYLHVQCNTPVMSWAMYTTQGLPQKSANITGITWARILQALTLGEVE